MSDDSWYNAAACSESKLLCNWCLFKWLLSGYQSSRPSEPERSRECIAPDGWESTTACKSSMLLTLSLPCMCAEAKVGEAGAATGARGGAAADQRGGAGHVRDLLPAAALRRAVGPLHHPPLLQDPQLQLGGAPSTRPSRLQSLITTGQHASCLSAHRLLRTSAPPW